MHKWMLGPLLLLPALAALDVRGSAPSPPVRSRADRDELPEATPAPRAVTRRTAARPAALVRIPAALPPVVPIAAFASDLVAAPAGATDDQAETVDEGELGDRWQAEANDEAWTAAATESLTEMMASAGLRAEVVQQVACRATLCRIELAFADFASTVKLAPVLAAGAGNMRVVAQPANELAHPEPRYLVYVARPGERIARSTEDEPGI